MRYVAIFLDDLDPKNVEEEITKAHFDYLSAQKHRIADAGGLKNDPNGAFCGTLWMITADSLEEAQDLADQDPYCKAGLRPWYRVLVWNQAPGFSPGNHGAR
ncbi:YciI family protein [Shimia sediminis]|uniref:YciI family protein n=1 Tax=Shimia sediminis TaxID=2497945 RepID=UPI000F8CC5AE|nr:YciI family protein [Shimia sediminis]